MQYEWKCNVCEERVTVHRRLDDRDVPPTTEEVGKTDDCLHPEWIRIISATSTPFEQLRDQGVLERTHWKRGT